MTAKMNSVLIISMKECDTKMYSWYVRYSYYFIHNKKKIDNRKQNIYFVYIVPNFSMVSVYRIKVIYSIYFKKLLQ